MKYNVVSTIGNVTVGTSELWRAALYGNYSEVKRLIIQGEDYTAKGSLAKCTPLHVAALMGHANIVLLLLDAVSFLENGDVKRLVSSNVRHAVNVDEKDVRGYTPLHYACDGIMPNVIEILIAHGACVSNTSNINFMPNHAALLATHDHSVPNAPSSRVNHLVPLEMAYNGNIHSITTDNNFIFNDNPSIEARYDKRMESVRILLVNGAVPLQELPCRGDITIWGHVITEYGTRLLELLLTEGRGVALPSYPSGRTLMHEVASLHPRLCDGGRDVRMLQMLFAYGMDPLKEDDHGNTVLTCAVRNENSEAVLCLVDLLYRAHRIDDDMLRQLKATTYNEDMRVAIDSELEKHRTERLLSVMMSRHDRLGKLSLLAQLEEEVLRMILE